MNVMRVTQPSKEYRVCENIAATSMQRNVLYIMVLGAYVQNSRLVQNPESEYTELLWRFYSLILCMLFSGTIQTSSCSFGKRHRAESVFMFMLVRWCSVRQLVGWLVCLSARLLYLFVSKITHKLQNGCPRSFGDSLTWTYCPSLCTAHLLLIMMQCEYNLRNLDSLVRGTCLWLQGSAISTLSWEISCVTLFPQWLNE